MTQLLLLLLGLISNPSQKTSAHYENDTNQSQQSLVGDTGGEEGHPIPPRIIGG